MNRIDAIFAEARTAKKRVFVPFLTAGDPDLATTFRVAKGIHATARDMGVPMVLEIGFPYSDPLADGPTIQSSYNRSLEGGVRVAGIFEAVKKFRQECDVPMVAMVSFTIVHRRKMTEFLGAAQGAGFDGMIVPDLPVEESQATRDWSDQHDFKMIQLVAPTTRADRLPSIAQSATGFIYYMSVTGITGERTTLPEDLTEKVRVLRSHANVPVCVGFGVSTAGQVAMLKPVADGVIVGSALVRRVAEMKGNDTGPVLDFVRTLIAPLAKD